LVSGSAVWKIILLGATLCKRQGICKELLKDPGEWRGFFVEDYSPKTPPNILIDIDNDGTDDAQGNCPSVANPDQKKH
jgi:hypothetical protein